MLFYHRGEVSTPAPVWYADSKRWRDYHKPFIRSKRLPQKTKPSSGLCAVFMVVERWNPSEIGLIGFDHIMDGNTEWEHDAIAEKACIESLVNIVDLRKPGRF